MKKILLMLVIAASLVTSSFAQDSTKTKKTHHMKKHTVHKMHHADSTKTKK